MDKVSAAIHVQLAHLTAKEKAAIRRLNPVEKETLQGKIMLKAAMEILAAAAAEHKKNRPMLKHKIFKAVKTHRATMLQEANATNGTNGTVAAEEEEGNPGAFDLTAWLDSQPDPRCH